MNALTLGAMILQNLGQICVPNNDHTLIDFIHHNIWYSRRLFLSANSYVPACTQAHNWQNIQSIFDHQTVACLRTLSFRYGSNANLCLIRFHLQ